MRAKTAIVEYPSESCRRVGHAVAIGGKAWRRRNGRSQSGKTLPFTPGPITLSAKAEGLTTAAVTITLK